MTKEYRELVLKSEKDINRITGYLLNVFIKQNRAIPFESLYGDGSIYKPFNKQGAKMIYGTLIEAIESQGIKINY